MTELPLFAQLTARQAVKAAKLVDCLIDELHDGLWHTAKELGPVLRTNDRVIRKCADLSNGLVISSDRGYKLLRFATVSEIYHAQGRLLSQAKRMTERAAQYQRELNKREPAA